MMQKLLIANRGEIAVRIILTAKRMGLKTVAVCSEADVESLAVRNADEYVVLGAPPAQQSYLNQEALLRAARKTGANAIHPGFGFLSENPCFARAVADAGLIWIGPSAEVIALMGDKVAARRAARKAGVPVLTGTNDLVETDPLLAARKVGFPLMIKASAGGGGKGIKVIRSEERFIEHFEQAVTEARNIFGDGSMYLERFVEHARHVEVQILGDGQHYVHLGTRDCSMQRHCQKVMEEAPAPNIPDHVRSTMLESSVHLAANCGYTGVGTVEFLFDPVREEAAFIEMNTRLQVEHPVTEMICGIDLVEQQIRVAAGEPLNLRQDDIVYNGHAFECRINAEDPVMDFFPSPGTINILRWPSSKEVRVDTGVEEGDEVVPFYDSMIAKLVVHGSTREAALEQLSFALNETEIEGVATTIALHRALAKREELANITHHTAFIESTADILASVEDV